MPRETMTISLPVALCDRLRAYCERRGHEPLAMATWVAEWGLGRVLCLLERVYPPSEGRDET